MPSYHDIFVTTETIKRTSIFNLPFRLMVTCTRTGGWELWNGKQVMAGEFDTNGLRIDVSGVVIVDSLTPKPPENTTVLK